MKRQEITPKISNRLVQLELFPLRLPFRHPFLHAAAQRSSTDTLIAAALLADGTVGFGEAVPRTYVTGETIESVQYDVRTVLADSLKNMQPDNFSEALEQADNLPFQNEQGRNMNCARCCVELALLDAYGKFFQTPLSGIAGWLGFGAFTSLRPDHPVRVSGILDGSRLARTKHRFRLMRWFGMHDFKLKLGGPHDEENLKIIYKKLKRSFRNERLSWRVDANGAWDIDTAVAMSEILSQMEVYCLEQPIAAGDQSHWKTLADLSQVPLMADESLLSSEDAEYFAQNDLVDYFNIRISKNGGLLPSLRLAEIAYKWGREHILGAMVGESGILAAAGIQFLQMVPHTAAAEIAYSTFLLREDLVSPPIRFGYGGKLRKLNGPGLGIEVKKDRLAKYLAASPRKIGLA